MGNNRHRQTRRGVGVVASLGAAAAVFAMATANTATAHAEGDAAGSAATDIFSAIQADVQADLATAQSEFSAAVTDFSSQNVPGGLEQLFSGVDNALFSPGEAETLDVIDYVVNGQDFGPFPFTVGTQPAVDIAAAFSQIEADYSTYLPNDLSQVVTYLEAFQLAAVTSADQAFGDALLYPIQSLAIGSVDQYLADGGSLPDVSAGLGEVATLLQGLL